MNIRAADQSTPGPECCPFRYVRFVLPRGLLLVRLLPRILLIDTDD